MLKVGQQELRRIDGVEFMVSRVGKWKYQVKGNGVAVSFLIHSSQSVIVSASERSMLELVGLATFDEQVEWAARHGKLLHDIDATLP